MPVGISSHVSQVPHGVAPPAQLRVVLLAIDWAAVIAPLLSNCTIDTPPPFSQVLETHNLPNADKISEAIRTLAAY